MDFLQDWSTKKKFERAFKIYFGRKDADGLSVMEPKPYKLRFQGIQFFPLKTFRILQFIQVALKYVNCTVGLGRSLFKNVIVSFTV